MSLADITDSIIELIRLVIVLAVFYVILDALMTDLIGIPLPLGV